MRHRIFLVPVVPHVCPGVVRRHWEERHGEVFTGTPGLLRYRQNRPVDEEWERGTARFCSETWYDDRDTERDAYRSTHYREVVTPDEASFLERDAAWSAVVLDEGGLAPGEGLRILWFDEAPPAGPAWRTVELDRAVPPPGTGTSVHVADVDDLKIALGLTQQASAVAMVCRAIHQDPLAKTTEEGR